VEFTYGAAEAEGAGVIVDDATGSDVSSKVGADADAGSSESTGAGVADAGTGAGAANVSGVG